MLPVTMWKWAMLKMTNLIGIFIKISNSCKNFPLAPSYPQRLNSRAGGTARNSSLTITRVGIEDLGSYSCVALNRLDLTPAAKVSETYLLAGEGWRSLGWSWHFLTPVQGRPVDVSWCCLSEQGLQPLSFARLSSSFSASAGAQKKYLNRLFGSLGNIRHTHWWCGWDNSICLSHLPFCFP